MLSAMMTFFIFVCLWPLFEVVSICFVGSAMSVPILDLFLNLMTEIWSNDVVC